MGNTGRTHFKKGHIPKHKGRRKYSFKCLNCKKVNGSFIDNRKYCNQDCYLEYKKNYPEEFRGIHKGQIPWNKGKKTGIVPKNAFKKGKMGKDSPNWKGGKTKLIKLIRTIGLYQEWRSSVFKRDNYACQKCGNKNGAGKSVELHAHHIIPFSIIIKEFGIRTIEQALKCKILWDVGNGITYCKKCHFHLKLDTGNKEIVLEIK